MRILTLTEQYKLAQNEVGLLLVAKQSDSNTWLVLKADVDFCSTESQGYEVWL